MPYLSISKFLCYCLWDWFVASIADERGGNGISNLWREKNISSTGRGNFDDFVEKDYKICKPSLNAEVVEYMSHTMANLLLHWSSFFFMNKRFVRFSATTNPDHFELRWRPSSLKNFEAKPMRAQLEKRSDVSGKADLVEMSRKALHVNRLYLEANVIKGIVLLAQEWQVWGACSLFGQSKAWTALNTTRFPRSANRRWKQYPMFVSVSKGKIKKRFLLFLYWILNITRKYSLNSVPFPLDSCLRLQK